MKKITILFSLVVVAILSFTGCGSLDEVKDAIGKNTDEKTDIVQRTGDADKDNNFQELAETMQLNTIYKGAVTKDDSLDWYVMENVQADKEYYFHLINLSENRKNTEVLFVMYDEEGKIMSKELSTISKEGTYIFVPKNNQNIYIKFYSNYLGVYHRNSRFQFDIKTEAVERANHDSATFEFNDFKNVSYPISLNQSYKSAATGSEDPNDWYVLENLKSDTEYYFHLKNLGEIGQNTNVQFILYDEDGKIKSAALSARISEATYTFSPITDGKVYIRFFTHKVGAYYGHMRYEFDVK